SVRCRTTTADKSVSSSNCSVSRSSITTPSSAVRFKILVYLWIRISLFLEYCIYFRRVELVPHASDPIHTVYHQLLNLQFRNVILAVVPVVEVLRVKVLIVESEDLLVDLTEALA
ncbi:hypothetical protein ALC56_13663, partial [Trachymyrmex septentrionalis]